MSGRKRQILAKIFNGELSINKDAKLRRSDMLVEKYKSFKSKLRRSEMLKN